MNRKTDINNKERKVIIWTMIISLICVIGVSYAFFTAGMTSETTTTVKADAGTMKINYSGGNAIDLSGIYPRDEVWATKEITVNGNNTTEAGMHYKLTLVIDNSTFSTSDPLQYELVSTNVSNNGETIPAVPKTDITGTSIELGSGHFVKANNARHTYQLKIYYPNKSTNQNNNQGATFSAHVEISNLKVTEFASAILLNNTVAQPATVPGKEIVADNEAILASTEDDYGTSYYFRGTVKNNYVQFANKCWRIVRINGDGTVKLILHNNNTTNVANPCSSSNNSDTASYVGTSIFNYGVDNAYIGFMYGATGSSDYESTHANINKSTIFTGLEAWYNSNLASFDKKIANTVWCNDKNNITDTTYDPMNISPTGLGYGTNNTYYAALKRLFGTNISDVTGPSLKCNGELSRITSKVGLLTADEAAFAGYAVKQSNQNIYLYENATTGNWWTLTPGVFAVVGDDYVIYLCIISGGSYDAAFAASDEYIRPSISLTSNVAISSGTGTSENPYVIQ